MGLYISRWESLGAPPQLLQILKGYLIPFVKKRPIRGFLPPHPSPLVTPSSPEMDCVIADLLASNIISPVKEVTGFLSPMFLVRKPDSSARPIFNLKSLNAFLVTKKFRLITHFSIPNFLQKSDYLVSINLSQAYCHVPVHIRHRRFLSLVYKNQVFSWTYV